MIHVFNHYVPVRVVILAALEGLVLVLAAYAGVYLHVAVSGGAATGLSSHAGLFAFGTMIVMAGMGLYQPDLWSNKAFLALRLAASFLLAALLMGLFSHVTPMSNPDMVALGIALTLALAGSVLLRTVFHQWSKADAFKPRVLVLGTGTRAVKLATHAEHDSHHEVVAFVAMQPSRHYVPESRVLAMEPNESLLSVVEKLAIDQIVIAVRDRRGGALPIEQLLECKAKGVKIMEMPTFFEREYRQLLLESLNPSWMVLGNGFRKDKLSSAAKRVFDLVVSSMLLLVSWPVMFVTALCIYMESGAPILFRQERVGKDGRKFQLYKFRSMRQDAEQCGTPQWAKANDGRTTRVGRIIRKIRIDELPQIFNVIRGDMSFVGPRPERPFFVDQLSQQIPYYALRHSAKPGITGWAQVRYPYGATVDDAIEKLQYDLYYVKNHSLFLDVMILISTVEVVLWGKGAR
jgi:sugar transferase (PEP-CTERM system associated)